MKAMFFAAGICFLTCGCEAPDGLVPRDNTAVNERDADGHTVTPMDQSNESRDIDQVAEIRARVLEIDDLSLMGRNVKIVTDNGKVVLRGPVASTEERERIAAIAEKIAGKSNVTNGLEVEP